jgi:hypothetical protein
MTSKLFLTINIKAITTELEFLFSNSWAEIHQALLSQLSLLAELFIGKVLVKKRDSRVLKVGES